jgi:hypothetical protein
MGMFSGFLGNVGTQLLFPTSCSKNIDWASVGLSTLSGGLGGLAGGALASAQSAQGMLIFTEFGQDIVSSSVAGAVAGFVDAYSQAAYQAGLPTVRTP